MRIFLLFALVLVFAAQPVAAADIYLKPKNDALPEMPSQATAPQAQPAPVPQTTPVPQPQDPQSAPAQAPMTMDEFAQKSYEKCLKQDHPIMKGEPLRMFCACTMEKVKQKMTIEEVVAMTTETEAGQAQRNRLVVHVYAQCIEYPVRALLLHNCKNNKDVLRDHAVSGETICNCMADDMAKYIAAHGAGVMAARLTANPNDQDPLGGFLASEAFRTQTENAFVACVGKNNPFEKKQ